MIPAQLTQPAAHLAMSEVMVGRGDGRRAARCNTVPRRQLLLQRPDVGLLMAHKRRQRAPGSGGEDRRGQDVLVAEQQQQLDLDQAPEPVGARCVLRRAGGVGRGRAEQHHADAAHAGTQQLSPRRGRHVRPTPHR